MDRQVFEEFDEERKQLARQLHSNAAQALAAIQINLSFIPPNELPARAVRALADCEELAASCAKDLKMVMQRLHPPLLEEAGLAATLRALAAQTAVKLPPDFPEDLGTLPQKIAIGVFRIAEEIVFYCESGAATLSVSREEDGIIISVAGAGDIRESVKARVDALGGRLSLRQNGALRTVIVQLPFTAAES